MPKLTESTAFSQAIGGTNYAFSGAAIDSLGAAEYTVATVILDTSGSTGHLRDAMEKAAKAIYRACKKNPRADNMLLRFVRFDHRVVEIHGFKKLADCNESDYDGCLGRGGGSTALWDACFTGIQAAVQYAEELVRKKFDVNGIVVVVTDGCEYPRGNSTATEKMVKDAMASAVSGEVLESLVSILIGLNANGQLDAQLQAVKDDCGFSQYIAISDANDTSIAKAGDFISRSISSQSQSITSGGPSQSLKF
jgi:hypothetical protein